jgi:hypothetical protein
MSDATSANGLDARGIPDYASLATTINDKNREE